MLGSMVIWIGSAVMIPTDKKETNVQASEAKVKSKEEANKKAAALAQAKKEAELKAKEDAEQKAKQDAEEKTKLEAEAKAKAEAEAQAKAQEQKATSTTTSGQTSFANCTELRKVYPNGVPSTHPAYTSKMDRDNDGYACEKN